ncbi:hypothetical protein SAMN05421874_109198, partial [Nonomuraea maritima]
MVLPAGPPLVGNQDRVWCAVSLDDGGLTKIVGGVDSVTESFPGFSNTHANIHRSKGTLITMQLRYNFRLYPTP